jgi:hypothetical protein
MRPKPYKRYPQHIPYFRVKHTFPQIPHFRFKLDNRHQQTLPL